MARTRICLARHGETNWNLERRVQGQLNIPLNVRGLAQAEALARELDSTRFDRIYSSDLKRAVQTVTPLARRLGLPIETSVALREKDDGDWHGMTFDDVDRAFPSEHAKHRQRQADFLIPGGETLSAFAARVGDELTAIAARHPGETVLVVAHAGVLDIGYRLATGLGLSEKRDPPVLHAAPNWFLYEDGRWTLERWAEEGARERVVMPYDGRKLERRPAARLLPLDEQNRVLLFRYSTRLSPVFVAQGHSHFWGSIGGALEPGETFDAAARRELAEETGLTDVEIGDIVFSREFPMQLGEDWFQADERFYAIRTGEFTPDTRGFTEIERSDVLGWNWWSAEEIASTQELVFPEALDWLLGKLRR
jgi:probable phosphoglycerate mutase